jgi:hypothetical protein
MVSPKPAGLPMTNSSHFSPTRRPPSSSHSLPLAPQQQGHCLQLGCQRYRSALHVTRRRRPFQSHPRNRLSSEHRLDWLPVLWFNVLAMGLYRTHPRRVHARLYRKCPTPVPTSYASDTRTFPTPRAKAQLWRQNAKRYAARRHHRP